MHITDTDFTATEQSFRRYDDLNPEIAERYLNLGKKLGRFLKRQDQPGAVVTAPQPT